MGEGVFDLISTWYRQNKTTHSRGRWRRRPTESRQKWCDINIVLLPRQTQRPLLLGDSGSCWDSSASLAAINKPLVWQQCNPGKPEEEPTFSGSLVCTEGGVDSRGRRPHPAAAMTTALWVLWACGRVRKNTPSANDALEGRQRNQRSGVKQTMSAPSRRHDSTRWRNENWNHVLLCLVY